jgi:hypothetical protein
MIVLLHIEKVYFPKAATEEEAAELIKLILNFKYLQYR